MAYKERMSRLQAAHRVSGRRLPSTLRAGANVAINHRKREEDAAETDAMLHVAMDNYMDEIKGHGVNHILVQADVSQEDQVEKMV